MSSYSGSNSLSPKLKFTPGDTIMSIGYAEESDTENYYYFSTAEQVGRSLFRGMNFHIDADKRRVEAEESLLRETQRYDAAIALGISRDALVFHVEKRRYPRRSGQFKATRYGTNPRLHVQYTGPILAVAALYAAPEHPSDFDISRLETFGFQDAQQVGETVLAWNVRGKIPHIPMPLNYETPLTGSG